MKRKKFYNALILLTLSISACGSYSKAPSSEESIIIDEGGFKNVNDTSVSLIIPLHVEKLNYNPIIKVKK